MFLETIRSEGIAHLSYLVGDETTGEAAVIDPRRDMQVYIDEAHARGTRIVRIFETHRNEDYVIGSQDLSRRTGASIHHGAGLPFGYGETVEDGDSFAIGNVELRVLSTPGHTYESISLVMADRSVSDEAIGVFTGDALFIGDVGRTDFFPERREEVAGLLYDSLFKTILPLGDHVILYPAHGAGSVCGNNMVKREFSTLGYEKRHNPMLQKTDRDEFVKIKANETHPLPPYFKKMEQYNLDGPPVRELPPQPVPLTADGFDRLMTSKLQVLDVRSPEALSGAFIEGSLAIPVGMIPAWAGWFLDYDTPIALVVEDTADVCYAVQNLYRIGYDNILGYLAGGMEDWETSGRPYDAIPAIHAGTLSERLEQGPEFTLLDVRAAEEFESGHLPEAKNIYLGDLPDRLDEVPKDNPVVTFCGSGRRALIGATILKKNGYEIVDNCLGSMAACQDVGCAIVPGEKTEAVKG